MNNEPAVPTPPSLPRVTSVRDWAVVIAMVGGGLCLLAVVVGLIILGSHSVTVSGASGGTGAASQRSEVAVTGLAAIGSTLAGGFAGWVARGTVERSHSESHG
jgi:hypothetical protein